MRPKKGNELWNKSTHYVVLYDTHDGLPDMVFENIWEIVDYKGWARNKSNYDIVCQELNRALKSEDKITRMLGHWSEVCLVNKEEDEVEN